MNKFKESEKLFASALEKLEASGKPDLAVSAMYRMGAGCVSLAEGFSATALDRLNAALPHLWKAEAEAAQADPWVGVQLIRGVSLLFGGGIQILQREYVKGGLNLTKAWSIIKPAAEEGLTYQGENADLVRSMALFLLGAMNLLVSILPAAIVSLAGFVGFDGKRSVALNRLKQCWKESGLFSAFAALGILNFHFLARPLIFEKLSQAEANLCERMLFWSDEKFPGSLLFDLFRGLHLLTARKPAEAIAVLSAGCEATEIPTLRMIFLYKRGFSKILSVDFLSAAEDFAAGAKSQLDDDRLSYVAACKGLEAMCISIHARREKRKLIAPEIARIDSCWLQVAKLKDHPQELLMASDYWASRKCDYYYSTADTRTERYDQVTTVIDILYGPILFFASMSERMPVSSRKEMKKLIEEDSDSLSVTFKCQRDIVLAEFSRQEKKRSSALDKLDGVLEAANEAEEAEKSGGWFGSSSGKNSLCLASEAVVPIALLWQGLIFVEAGEKEAALESLKELDDGLARDAGILGIGLNAIGIAADTGTEFDAFLKFRRSGLKRLAEKISQEESDSDNS